MFRLMTTPWVPRDRARRPLQSTKATAPSATRGQTTEKTVCASVDTSALVAGLALPRGRPRRRVPAGDRRRAAVFSVPPRRGRGHLQEVRGQIADHPVGDLVRPIAVEANL